jgi:hypothetical protein
MRLAAAIACLLGMAFTQTQTPARDARVEATGTAVISGVVQTDDAEGRPLRRATVRLTGDALMTARQTFTGPDGRFEFAGLPAGQYALRAQKSPFMNAEYGARRPGGTGSPLAIGTGERVTDIALRLPRFAEISGVIYDQNGEPAAGVYVEALRSTMRTGRRTISNVYGQPATTDDRGVYRFGGLLPGQYYLAAGPNPSRGWADLRVLADADVDRSLQRIAAGPDPIASIPFTHPHQTFSPVYFPGSSDLAGAQPIVLKLGEERTGVNFRLQLVPATRVDGTVTLPDGRPAAGAVVVPTAVTEAYSMSMFAADANGSASADADGRFTFLALPAGRFVFTARLQPSAKPPATGALWARSELTLSGDQQTASLVLQPGSTVSGRVAFSGASAAPANATGLRIGMTSLDPVITIGVPAAVVAADGTFQITGAPPGRYRLTVTVLQSLAGWFARSAVVQGSDGLDVPITLDAGRDLHDVVVTLTDRPTELSGSLQSAGGVPTSDYFIVVFSVDRSHWTPNSRRSVMTRPTSAGRYLIRNLPPGEYCVAAVTDLEPGDWYDPELLAALLASPATTRVTFVESDSKVLDLRIGSRLVRAIGQKPHTRPASLARTPSVLLLL